MACQRLTESFSVRVRTWPGCGRPLAVGGPSRKTNFALGSLAWLRLPASTWRSNVRSAFQRAITARSMSSGTYFLGTGPGGDLGAVGAVAAVIGVSQGPGVQERRGDSGIP